VSESSTMTLVRRILVEHRRAVYVLGGALVLNLVVFVAFVYPLQRDVANVEQRTRDAETARAAARAEHARASGTQEGRDRAVTELRTFYASVLPSSQAAARRLTNVELERLAAESGVAWQRAGYAPDDERDGTLTRLAAVVELRGAYDDVRAFVHGVESAPEFIVIENLVLFERVEGDPDLQVVLQLSTYFPRQDR